MNQFIPELLIPAGNLDKLKVAVAYGADAVYLAGLKFGLRAAADNFTYAELTEGVNYAHAHNVKVYVVLNGFLHDEDLKDLPAFLAFLNTLQVDAFIVSDLGVITIVQEHSNIPVHLSTQASCVNSYGAKIWKELGAERIVLGREVSVLEGKKIKQDAAVEIEMFIHGSMCMAYSGNCVISNFTQGRDSNRGGCAHSCRFEYSLTPKAGEQKITSYFMSSKDLNGLKLLPEFIDAKIDSLKVEGRMKSPLYAATTAKAYSTVIKEYVKSGLVDENLLAKMDEELTKVSHRDYTYASLLEKADKSSIFNERETSNTQEYVLVGQVLEASPLAGVVMEVRTAFHPGDELEFVTFGGSSLTINVPGIKNLFGDEIQRTRPSTVAVLPYTEGIFKNQMIRMRPL